MPQLTLVEPAIPATPDRRRPPVALAVILTAQLMVVLDTTIVNVALPHIQSSLGFSSSALSWVLNAYILAFGGLLLLGARSGDLLGRRRVFLAGIGLFSASSLAGGLGASAWMLLAARALQGIGAAMAAPAALALLTALFPEGRERVRAIAMFTTVSATGAAVGLLAGGLLTQWASWRSVMFVNVPVGLAVLGKGRRLLAETPLRAGRFDLAGGLTSTLGVGGVVLGLVQAGSAGWSAPLTLGPLVAGAGLLGAFVRIESRAAEPILPLRLLVHPTRMSAKVARGLAYAGMYGMLFFLTQFFQEVQGYSPLLTGLAFLPVPVSVFAASQLTGRVLVERFSPKALMMSGTLLGAAGLVLASQVHAGTSYAQVLASLEMFGIGSGLSFVSMTTAALTDVAPPDAGAASGLINVSQQLGGAFGLAVLVSVFDAVAGSGAGSGFARASATASATATAAAVHGLDMALLTGAGFALTATAVVGLAARRQTRHDRDLAELEAMTALVEI